MKEWIKKLLKEEWELTIFYPGEIKVLPDGTQIKGGAPVTYNAKKLTKITDKHFIFVGTDGVRQEIKLTDPVGYSLRKVY